MNFLSFITRASISIILMLLGVFGAAWLQSNYHFEFDYFVVLIFFAGIGFLITKMRISLNFAMNIAILITTFFLISIGIDLFRAEWANIWADDHMRNLLMIVAITLGLKLSGMLFGVFLHILGCMGDIAKVFKLLPAFITALSLINGLFLGMVLDNFYSENERDFLLLIYCWTIGATTYTYLSLVAPDALERN